jgi:hypothetical protein
MSKNIKKSRKAVQNYTFNSDEGEVEIDLNNFTAVCSVTNNPKKFYHSYLANLIVTKYDNNISTFNNTYVSREGKSESVNQNKIDSVENRINQLYQKIRELKEKSKELQAETQSA